MKYNFRNVKRLCDKRGIKGTWNQCVSKCSQCNYAKKLLKKVENNG